MEKENSNFPKQISAKDVAKFCGVSQSTVSRVFSGEKNNLISDVTRKRVIEIAKQLGYSPDPIARAMRSKQTNLIGVIVRDISDPFFADFISKLSLKAGIEGFRIILGSAQGDPEKAKEFDTILDARNCDGVILLGDLENDENYLRQLLLINRPVLAVCRGKSPDWISTVNSNNTFGMRLAIDYLVELGHERFAFINGGWLGDMRDRLESYKSHLAELNINIPDEYIVSGKNDSEGGFFAMRKLLECKPLPTAVCAADDMLAIGALRAIHDSGLRVPEDISLVGFDDIQQARFVYPRLTTVKQNVEELSDAVLLNLISLIKQNSPKENRKSILIQPELIIRESTGPNRNL